MGCEEPVYDELAVDIGRFKTGVCLVFFVKGFDLEDDGGD